MNLLESLELQISIFKDVYKESLVTKRNMTECKVYRNKIKELGERYLALTSRPYEISTEEQRFIKYLETRAGID